MARKKTKRKAAPARKPAARSRTTKAAKKKPAARKPPVRKAVPKKSKLKSAAAKPAAAAVQQAPPPVKLPTGSFVWHELTTTDAARSKDFYGRLFGWKASNEEMMPGFVYTTFMVKDQIIGGMMPIGPELGVQPHWMLYVSVKDVDATAAKAEQMGGEILIPPHDIPVGRWAKIKDPTGAQIAIYKKKGSGRG